MHEDFDHRTRGPRIASAISAGIGVLTLALDFTKSAAVRDIVVLQPGYNLASYPTFTNEYLGLLRDLSPNLLRLMDFTQANDNPVSVRALAHIIAGHELHHVGLLRERYGLS